MDISDIEAQCDKKIDWALECLDESNKAGDKEEYKWFEGYIAAYNDMIEYMWRMKDA